jgi:hypothetical protein
MNSSDNFNQGGLSTNSESESKTAGETAANASTADASSPAIEPGAPVALNSENKSEAAPTSGTTAPAPKMPSPAVDAKGEVDRPAASLSLIPFIAGQRAETPSPTANAHWRALFEKRFQLGAIAAGLAVAGGVAIASLSYKAQQDQYLVLQNSETQDLAETVKALKARLSAIDAAKHEDILELRKSVAELKTGFAALHDSSAAMGQFSARAERLEHDEATKHDEIVDLRKSVAELKTGLAAAHDSTALLTQFNGRADRIEHDEATHNSEFTARLEKLEKKAAAPVVASIAPPAAAPVPVPAPAPLTKQLPVPPVAANVSKETTSSIGPQTPIHGWAVREVHGNVAIVEGPYGFRQIGPGDMLPGAGHVERIERRASGWTVVTDRGIINSAYNGGGYRAYGAFNGDYGPAEGEF